MAFLRAPYVKFKENDDNGNPLSGGRVFTYIAGTTTPINTYSDNMGTLNPNPIELDGRGEANIYLDDNIVYKFVLKTALPEDREIWEEDNIFSSGGSSTGQDLPDNFIFVETSEQALEALARPINYKTIIGLNDLSIQVQNGNSVEVYGEISVISKFRFGFATSENPQDLNFIKASGSPALTRVKCYSDLSGFSISTGSPNILKVDGVILLFRRITIASLPDFIFLNNGSINYEENIGIAIPSIPNLEKTFWSNTAKLVESQGAEGDFQISDGNGGFLAMDGINRIPFKFYGTTVETNGTFRNNINRSKLIYLDDVTNQGDLIWESGPRLSTTAGEGLELTIGSFFTVNPVLKLSNVADPLSDDNLFSLVVNTDTNAVEKRPLRPYLSDSSLQDGYNINPLISTNTTDGPVTISRVGDLGAPFDNGLLLESTGPSETYDILPILMTKNRLGDISGYLTADGFLNFSRFGENYSIDTFGGFSVFNFFAKEETYKKLNYGKFINILPSPALEVFGNIDINSNSPNLAIALVIAAGTSGTLTFQKSPSQPAGPDPTITFDADILNIEKINVIELDGVNIRVKRFNVNNSDSNNLTIVDVGATGNTFKYERNLSVGGVQTGITYDRWWSVSHPAYTNGYKAVTTFSGDVNNGVSEPVYIRVNSEGNVMIRGLVTTNIALTNNLSLNIINTTLEGVSGPITDRSI